MDKGREDQVSPPNLANLFSSHSCTAAVSERLSSAKLPPFSSPNTKKIKELVASRICQKMHLEDLCDIMWQWASWNNSQTGKTTFRGGLVRPSVVAMPCGAAVVVVLGHFCIVALRSINEFQGIRVCLRKVHCQDIKAWLKLGATAKTPFGVASPLPTEITEITGILQISQCSQLKRMKVLRWWI